MAGTRLALEDVARGHVTVLNVWAAWCVECRAESRTLSLVQRALASRGVRFVGIDEQDTVSGARRFLARVHTGYPSLIDRDGRLLAQLTVLPNTGIPSTLVIDRKDRMAGRVVGLVHRGSLARLIERVAAG